MSEPFFFGERVLGLVYGGLPPLACDSMLTPPGRERKACEKVKRSVTQRAAFPKKTLDKIKHVCTLILLLVLWGFLRLKNAQQV